MGRLRDGVGAEVARQAREGQVVSERIHADIGIKENIELFPGDVFARLDQIEREFDEGYEYALASPFPEPGDATRGLWVEDWYWTSEPGRGGGTEAG